MEPDFSSINFRKVGAFLFEKGSPPSYHPSNPSDYVMVYIKDGDGVMFSQLFPINSQSQSYENDMESILTFMSVVFSIDINTLVEMFS